jgi:hypothetical protein
MSKRRFRPVLTFRCHAYTRMKPAASTVNGWLTKRIFSAMSAMGGLEQSVSRNTA